MSTNQNSERPRRLHSTFLRCCRSPRGRTRPLEYDEALVAAPEKQLHVEHGQVRPRQRSRNTIFGGRPDSSGTTIPPARHASRKREHDQQTQRASRPHASEPRPSTSRSRVPSRSRTRLKKSKPSEPREMLQHNPAQIVTKNGNLPDRIPSLRLSAMDLALPRNSRMSSFPDFGVLRPSELSFMAKSPWLIVREMAEGNMTPKAGFPPMLSPMLFSPPRTPMMLSPSRSPVPRNPFVLATDHQDETFLELSLTNEPIPQKPIPEISFTAESPYNQTFPRKHEEHDIPERNTFSPTDAYTADPLPDEPLPFESRPRKSTSNENLSASKLGSWTQQQHHQRAISHPIEPVYPKRVDSKRPALAQSKSADSYTSLTGGDRWDFSHRLRDMRSDIRSLTPRSRPATPGKSTSPMMLPEMSDPPPIPQQFRTPPAAQTRAEMPKTRSQHLPKALTPTPRPEVPEIRQETLKHPVAEQGANTKALPASRMPQTDPRTHLARVGSQKRMPGGRNVLDMTASEAKNLVSNATLSSQFVHDGQEEPRMISIGPNKTGTLPDSVKAQPPAPTPVARWVHSIRPSESPDAVESDSSGTFFLTRPEGNYSGFHESSSTLAQPGVESAIDIDSIYDVRERRSQDHHGPALRESRDVYLAPPTGRRGVSSESRGTSGFLTTSDAPERPMSTSSIMTWSSQGTISPVSSRESITCLPPTPVSSRTPVFRNSGLPMPMPRMPAPLQIGRREPIVASQVSAPARTETAHQSRPSQERAMEGRRSHERRSEERRSKDETTAPPRRTRESRTPSSIDATALYGSALPRHSPSKAPLIPARSSSRQDNHYVLPPRPPSNLNLYPPANHAVSTTPAPHASNVTRPLPTQPHKPSAALPTRSPPLPPPSAPVAAPPPTTTPQPRPTPISLPRPTSRRLTSTSTPTPSSAPATFSLFPTSSLTPPPPPPPPRVKRRDLVMDLQRSASARRKRQIAMEVERELEREGRREENEAGRSVEREGFRRSQVGIAF
ncbi:MAG: hypothetical protein M1828_000534 [Chrysothrix sp. TS-e1954]|nr:MAG: hypothetical protein M1828_000534 [Chrysothrix sp. TS-e1954]